MRSDYKTYIPVGRINASLVEKVGFAFRGVVYASPGVLNHIKKRHGKQFSRRVKDNLISIMKDIISNPDYIGVNNGEGTEGELEIVKSFGNIILLALKVDLSKNYIYVSTMYPITKSKVNNRLFSGRFIKYEKE